ncbi:MAG TPA: hypothetical protein VKR21_11680 [Solirubrobacteraceae bacterium]|nr:hypothetical protein [Solirubrobacteraceae bacterium]
MKLQRNRHQTDDRVDDYIDRLAEWQQAICRELRELIHRPSAGSCAN